VRVAVDEELKGEDAGEGDVEPVEGLPGTGEGAVAVEEAGVELRLCCVDDKVLQERCGEARRGAGIRICSGGETRSYVWDIPRISTAPQ
jgi:hypothetical protein